MSYDLVIRGSADRNALVESLKRLPHASSVEIHLLEQPGELLVAIPASVDDRAMTTLRVSLAKLCETGGLTLFDPQVGEVIEMLKVAVVRKMATQRRYAQLQSLTHRIDLAETDEHDLTALDHVLYSRIEGATMKSGDSSWKALQNLAIAMIEAGADPFARRKAGKYCSLLGAVKTDHSKVVEHVLKGLSKAERDKALRQKWDYLTLLEHASRGMFSDRTVKMLKRLGAKR